MSTILDTVLWSKNAKHGINNQREHTMEYEQHASSRRSCFLGFEIVTELVWDDWDLGKALTKTLIIKNTQSKLQKILFRPPLSKYFTSLARQKIVLSPGTSFSIPVTFKPLTRCDYEDTVEFQGKDDSFQVCLRAPAPRHAIQVPESVLLPLCAVQHSTYTTFVLKNVSKLKTFFHWESASSFMLTPEQGLLRPGQEQDITVAFQPQEALVYQQLVTCKFGTEANTLESCCSILLEGLGKYPYLEFKSPSHNIEKDQTRVLDFGSVAVGHTLHKHFEIYNPSPVPVSFTLSRLPGGINLLDSVFSCDLPSAEVAPGASLKATVTFRPATVDTTSVEYLSLICRGAVNESLLKLTGSCVGPKVLLSSYVVDFGHVDQGQKVTHTVKLVNSSPAEAVFQWDLDCSGFSVFCIQPAGGTVPPHGHSTLTVSYKPTNPHPHHRRVTCLILHREPVFLDLIGNCHSEMPLKQADHRKALDKSPEMENDQGQDSVTPATVTPVTEYYQSCLGGKDPFSPASPQLSVVPSELAFNKKVYILPENLTSQKALTITNNRKVKLRLVWTVPSDLSFSVSPLSCELSPMKCTSFRVIYCPKQLNSLHGAQLECFVYNMQDSGNISESVPPSCVTVRVVGHSFEPGKKHTVPQCSLEPSLVEFPPVKVASYRSVLLQNNGDLPLTFNLNPELDQKQAKAASLVLVPSCGFIQSQAHQILFIRTIPTEGGPKQGFSLQLDLNADYMEKLTVISQAESPCVSIEGDGKLLFQPTVIKSLTQRLHQIRNLGRQALRFQWRIPEQDRALISVEPDAGVLHPNESLMETWSFTPLEEKAYAFKPMLTVCPMQFPDYDNLLTPLEVTGTGSFGFIQAKKDVLNVEDVLIGGCQTINIPLINSSPCSVSFCVSVQQKLLDQATDYDLNAVPCALQLVCERETIPSQSTILLQSMFRPHRKAQYMWIISYQTINANGSLSSPAKELCKVYARGVYPTLQVTDVCGSSSMSQFSKKHLWKLLSLDDLNQLLQSNPCPPELTYSTPTRHSLYPSPSIFTKAIVDFSFSAAPLNSDPSTFMLMLYNPGYIPVEWAFLFPEDQLLDLEYWAETGEFSSTELYQMKVQDNKLFTVTPRSGKLMSGQQKAVTFTYSHDFVGTDRFPVLFKISYGREILLTLQGITVQVDRPYLHFASNTHIFASVATGDHNPPKQVYQLYNQGAVPVQYEVDKAVFSQLQKENFNHSVLCCLNPDGEIPPGESAILEWIFSPLEAEIYQMDIPIYIQNGEFTVVRFEGCGLNSTAQKLSNLCDNSAHRVPFPGHPAFLSEDNVSFGNVAISSKSSKMLFLNNKSQDIVRYEWVLPQQISQPQRQVLDINSNRGSLCPGETAQCVLTFTATEYPTVYQFDLVCKITPEAALIQYCDAVQRMEEEKKRQQQEFTITDKPPTERKISLTEKEAEAVAMRQQSYINKYKTLPPIRATNDCNVVRFLSTKSSRAERRALRELAKIQKDPEPPKPCVLHLWVTAQTYAVQEFINQSPDQLKCQYRSQQLELSQRPESVSSSQITERLSLVQGLKTDMSSNVFTWLLRDILDDTALVENLTTLASKPVKYQIPITPPSCPSPKPTSSNEPASMPHKEEEDKAKCLEDGGSTEKTVFSQHTDEMCLVTLQNLMVEVLRGELDLTVHPTLRPASARSVSRNLDQKDNMG